jgi:DNA polymerase
MFVGEAPGHEEDVAGLPFVGPSGKLLTCLMKRAGILRESVYIANLLKCRPPGNRDPEPSEIKECFPFLEKQIATIRPKVLVALGRHAVCRLSLHWGPMNVLIGKTDLVHETPDGIIPVMALWHPSFLLRNIRSESPEMKALFQDFVQRLADLKAKYL